MVKREGKGEQMEGEEGKGQKAEGLLHLNRAASCLTPALINNSTIK